MKNIKKIKIFIPFIVLFALIIVSCERELDNQDHHLDEMESLNQKVNESVAGLRSDPIFNSNRCTNYDDCETTIFSYAEYVVDLEISPGCSARAIFDVTLCIVNSSSLIYQFNFDNYRAFPIFGQCDSIFDYWNDLIDSNDLTTLLGEINDFSYYVSEIAEEWFIDNYLNNEGQASIFGCNNPTTLLFAEFSFMKCTETWITTIFDPGNPDRPPIVNLECGSMCCRRRTLYCYNSEGNIHQSNQQFTLFGDDCDGPSTIQPDPPIDHTYTLIGECGTSMICGEN